MPRRRSAEPELFPAAPAYPGGLVYAPDFLDAAEERALVGAIAGLPLAEARYRQFTAHRRTVSYGSTYDFSTNRLGPAPPVPEWLWPLRARVAAWAGSAADAFVHALVTEYRPGTQLGWHRDVPDFGVVVGVSLLGAARMRFRPWPPDRATARAQGFALELAPRSAYVLRDEVRWRWQHAISPTPTLRYSITLRTSAGRADSREEPTRPV